MPYRIRKQPNANLYKVYTPAGKALSKKGLPKTRARKQQIAVSISEGIYKTKPKKGK
jgi:hypothetical protein